MQSVISNSKEILLVYTSGKYAFDSEEDKKLLNETLEVEEMLSLIETVCKSPTFMRIDKMKKTLRVLKLILLGMIAAAVVLGITAKVLLDYFATSTSSSLWPLANYITAAYLAVLIFCVLMAGIIYPVEFFKLDKLFAEEAQKIMRSLEDNFYQVQFAISLVNGDFNILLRTIEFRNQGIDLKQMDYYDYIAFNNPESENFYKNRNPFEWDPYERKIKNETNSST